MHMKMIEFQVDTFALFQCSFGPPSSALVAYHLEKDGIPFHDEIKVNCEKGETTVLISRRRCIVYGLRGVCWIIMCTSSELT